MIEFAILKAMSSNASAADAADAPLPAASPLGEDLSFLLARANALSLAAGNAALRGLGLKVRSFSVLALAVADARTSQREIAEFLRLDPSQVVALVDELERRGLLTRESDPVDRRAKVVVATAEGRRVHAAAQRAATEAEAVAHANLTSGQRDQLTGLLRMIAFPAEAPGGAPGNPPGRLEGSATAAHPA